MPDNSDSRSQSELFPAEEGSRVSSRGLRQIFPSPSKLLALVSRKKVLRKADPDRINWCGAYGFSAGQCFVWNEGAGHAEHTAQLWADLTIWLGKWESPDFSRSLPLPVLF